MSITKINSYSQIKGLPHKIPCKLASTVNISNILTGAPNLVDGVSVSLYDRILVINQTDKKQNGIYIVNSVGTGSNGAWVRSSDFSSNSDIYQGIVVDVLSGTYYSNKNFILISSNPIVLGTSDIIFESSLIYSFIPVTVYPVSGVHTFDLKTGTNFKTDAGGSMTLAFTNLVVGQAGTIMIYNSSIISPQPLPSYVYTPNGFSIDWVVTSGVISMISYYVYDNTGLGKVLINYVGDFKST